MLGLGLNAAQVLALALALVINYGWWRGTVVERRSLAGELSLSCA